MEQAEIQRIREYVTKLEEGLFECDYRGITTLRYTHKEGFSLIILH